MLCEFVGSLNREARMANLGMSRGSEHPSKFRSPPELSDRKNLAVAKVSVVVNPPHKEADLERALWFLYQQWKLAGFSAPGTLPDVHAGL